MWWFPWPTFLVSAFTLGRVHTPVPGSLGAWDVHFTHLLSFLVSFRCGSLFPCIMFPTRCFMLVHPAILVCFRYLWGPLGWWLYLTFFHSGHGLGLVPFLCSLGLLSFAFFFGLAVWLAFGPCLGLGVPLLPFALFVCYLLDLTLTVSFPSSPRWSLVCFWPMPISLHRPPPPWLPFCPCPAHPFWAWFPLLLFPGTPTRAVLRFLGWASVHSLRRRAARAKLSASFPSRTTLRGGLGLLRRCNWTPSHSQLAAGRFWPLLWVFGVWCRCRWLLARLAAHLDAGREAVARAATEGLLMLRSRFCPRLLFTELIAAARPRVLPFRGTSAEST